MVALGSIGSLSCHIGNRKFAREIGSDEIGRLVVEMICEPEIGLASFGPFPSQSCLLGLGLAFQSVERAGLGLEGAQAAGHTHIEASDLERLQKHPRHLPIP